MKKFSFILLMLFFILPVVARAGGPFFVEGENRMGVPLQWLDDKLIWVNDIGPLGSSVSNETALGWVRAAMDRWANTTFRGIDTVDVSHEESGSLDEDFTTLEDIELYFENNPDFVGALIIFDENGSILQELGFNTDPNAGKIVALTAILAADESGTKITQGIIVLDGTFLDFLGTMTNAKEVFRAALLHEIGHLYNLDHSQVNLDLAEACELGATCDGGGNIPTMFPELKTYRQNYPISDDEITLSWIYPTEEFLEKFCIITGEILDNAEQPLQGVNVFARAASGTQDPVVDRRSMVTGSLYPACTADGHYYLWGIIPGKDYVVEYEPLSEQYSAESGFEPLSGMEGIPLPPTGFESAVISKGDDTTVRCENGGDVITMDNVQLEVANPCSELAQPGGGPDLGSGSVFGGAEKSGCSLMSEQTTFNIFNIALGASAALIVIMAVRRRRRLRKCRS